MRQFVIVDVVPVGAKRETVLIYDSRTGSSIQDIDGPIYPPSPRGERLRKVRISPNVAGYFSELTASRILGLRRDDLSRLENGSATLENDDEWDRAERALRDAATGNQ